MKREKVFNAGFTLVELILVIVVLGILSAFVIPKFIDLSEDASSATAKGLFASFRSAISLAHMQWLAKGRPSSITLQGHIIPMTDSGWPGNQSMSTTECIAIWKNLTNSSTDLLTTEPGPGKNQLKVLSGHFYCNYLYLKAPHPSLDYFPNNKGRIIIKQDNT